MENKMYQIVYKGYFETENPDKFLQDLNEIVSKNNVTAAGKFETYMLAPYVDYIECDVKDVSDTDSNI